MKLIIAGGNYFVPEATHWTWLDRLHAVCPITEVVCGIADVAESFGISWAQARGVPAVRFRLDWRTYDQAAPRQRNGQMADRADAVVLLPGGRFTASMYRKSVETGLTILDWRDRE